MIDDKKIKEAAMQHSRWLNSNHEESTASDSFMEGAKWMQEEFLKDLWHPASEEPKNLEYIIFTNDIFGEIYFFTIQRDNSLQSWETEVACHGIDQWAYRNDIVSLILKGGKQ